MLRSGNRVIALYSGLAPRRRRGRHFLSIQAFIDDSAEAGQVLVLAGYLASVEEWAEFSKTWQERLDHAGWKSVHMNEIGSSPERMITAGWFYRAIEDHLKCFVAIAVHVDSLKRAVTDTGFRDAMVDPSYLDNPYILAFRAILDLTAQYQHELGITEPVDFIFDERREEQKVRAGFEVFKEYCREDIKDRLGSKPRFEDDEEFLPLQAADILAWHVRKHWLRYKSITNGPIEISWQPKRDIKGYCFDVDYEDIKSLLLSLKDRLIAAGHGSRMSISVSFSCDLSLPNDEKF